MYINGEDKTWETTFDAVQFNAMGIRNVKKKVLFIVGLFTTLSTVQVYLINW